MPKKVAAPVKMRTMPVRQTRATTSVPPALMPKSRPAKPAKTGVTSARQGQNLTEDVMEEASGCDRDHADQDSSGIDEEEDIMLEDREGSEEGESVKKRGRGRPKALDVAEYQLSVTISKKGEDLNCRAYVEGIQEYAEANTVKFYMAAERGAIEKHLHFQGMAIVNTSTLAAFRKSLYKAMGFGASKDGLNPTPPGLSICLKQLTGKGLHTPTGIIGYSRKERNSQDGGEYEEW